MLIPKSNSAERLELLRNNEGFIRIAALRITAGARHVEATDFVDESPNRVWLKMEKIDLIDTETFKAFCKTVLRHDWIDLMRRRRMARLSDLGFDEQAADDGDLIRRIQEMDRTAEFSPADADRIRTWRFRPCVAVLCFYGLWQKLPRKLQVERLRVITERSTFPPQPFSADAIAIALGANSDAIKKMLQRNRGLLGELDYVKALLE